ncbi:type I-F CRISPR-associated endonuclease Cas1f [Thiorhodovibrio frisius]|uniref:CRISPR-associated endonuclease Cas1 n=1 Tax=Thiorhodovibrio frisius TaxID=631362 RepID=H8Z7X6_9GAMM|nr:type I-F CRISPR-associated endonuclease Cas1f [Thiorhodovibrio frisius]EIC20988.1 CRISPR-associated endonuclease Cas1 [Thiorhodovibrio frisius]WPL22044.1 CRISPR-associated endonuclease Cas1 [Thiorhodovibrio frisius]
MTAHNPAKPRQILLSKRANVFYLEHARVIQKDGRILYLTDTGEDVEQYFNLPERNTMFLLLGKGTSITDAAVRRLAESNVILGFCGSGGSPQFATLDPVFLVPQSEYRPTEFMQGWVRSWFEESDRLAMAKRLLSKRVHYAQYAWSSNIVLKALSVELPKSRVETFLKRIIAAENTQELLLAEAEWAKHLYAKLAATYRINNFARNEGAGETDNSAARVNSFLDHGNYIAYGYAAMILNALGISFSLPLLHGKTRRGALVFDIADLIKDAWVMPTAFAVGANEKSKDRDMRAQLIESVHDSGAVDEVFSFVKSLALEPS